MRRNSTQICKAIKTNGSRCKSPSIVGSSYCFFHDPNRAEDRLSAQTRGGQKGLKRAIPSPDECPNVNLKTPDDVRELISDTINKLRVGKMETKICSTVGYLAQVGLRAIEQAGLEERIRRIEETLGISSRS